MKHPLQRITAQGLFQYYKVEEHLKQLDPLHDTEHLNLLIFVIL